MWLDRVAGTRGGTFDIDQSTGTIYAREIPADWVNQGTITPYQVSYRTPDGEILRTGGTSITPALSSCGTSPALATSRTTCGGP